MPLFSESAAACWQLGETRTQHDGRAPTPRCRQVADNIGGVATVLYTVQAGVVAQSVVAAQQLVSVTDM